MSDLLQINNLIVSFKNPEWELTAVKGVSLSLKAGETLALVGESGCGKTVLCKSMLKILCEKGQIQQGEILLDEENLVPLSEEEMQVKRGGDIAMIFQDPMTSLDPAFSVGEQIAEVIRIHKKLPAADAKAQALELMRLVQIPDADIRYLQRPYQFSGGMRQRIVIAIALAAEPKLLLADEPTTALDEETQEEILKLLKEIRKKTGVAVLFITHDLSIVEDIADRVAIMKEGQLVECGNVAEVFAEPEHEYTRKLLGYLDYKKNRGHNHRGRQHENTAADDKQRDIYVNIRKYESSGMTDLQNNGNMEIFTLRNDDCRSTLENIECFETLISVRNLNVSFDIGRKLTNNVLRDFSLDIHRGEIVGIVGKSGCGKSTLSRCIIGLEKYTGAVDVRDGANIQMIFQDTGAAFNDRMTVGEIIAEPLAIAGGGVYKKVRRRLRKKRMRDGDSCSLQYGTECVGKCAEDAELIRMKNHMMHPQTECNKKSRNKNISSSSGEMTDHAKKIYPAVEEAMRAVELDFSLINRRPYELSGGQRQRVAIARALITKPDLVIADEPLTGLDVSTQAQIVHLFKKLSEQHDMAILFIAHDLPMVNHISDRVVRMG